MRNKRKFYNPFLLIIICLSLLYSTYAESTSSGKASELTAYRELQSFSLKDTPSNNGLLEVHQVRWNPTKSLVAIGGYSNSASFIELWNPITAQFERTLNSLYPSPQIEALEWSHNGRYLAASYHNFDHIHLWGISVNESTFYNDLQHNGSVRSISWSPSSDQLVSSGGDNSLGPLDPSETRSVYIWDVQDNTHIHTFPYDTRRVMAISWQPNGNLLAAATWENEIQVWDMAERKLINTFLGYGSDWDIDVRPVYNLLKWKPKVEILASTSCNPHVECAIWIMDIKSGDIVQLFYVESQDRINDISWHPSGAWLVGATKNGSIITWDTETGEAISSIRLADEAISIDWSENGTYLVVASRDGVIKTFEFLLEYKS